MTRKKSTDSSKSTGRGGRRPGAGRPVGKGRIQGEKKIQMWVPERCRDMVKRIIETQDYRVPVYNSGVRAGTPSDVPDEFPDMIGLVEYLTENPEATVLAPAEGDSMIEANIFDGDTLIINGAREPKDGDIVVASVNNEGTVKRLRFKENNIELHPANPKYSIILITEETAFHIWGVVKKKVADVG